MLTKRVLVEISGHGLGHLSQTAPVINALRQRLPDLHLIVRTEIPQYALRKRIEGEIQIIARATDPGLTMTSAVHVDVSASSEAYQRFHAGWPRAVDKAAREIERLKADFLISNVSYLALAGAARAGVPCAAMSSINWADVFDHYCGDVSGAGAVVEQIRSAYACAEFFLALTPGMQMPAMPRLRRIGPVAVRGRESATYIRRRLGVSAQCPLVLLALGGIPTTVSAGQWPPIDDMAVITEWQAPVPGYFDASLLEIPFIDVLASCDAVVTKPGYGTFVEAACNGVRVLYTRRPDWPESRWLCDWLHHHAVAAAMDWRELTTGTFVQHLRRLLALPPRPPVECVGVEAAAEALVTGLRDGAPADQSAPCQ